MPLTPAASLFTAEDRSPISDRSGPLLAIKRGSAPRPLRVRIHSTSAISGAEADLSLRQSDPKALLAKVSPSMTARSAACPLVRTSKHTRTSGSGISGLRSTLLMSAVARRQSPFNRFMSPVCVASAPPRFYDISCPCGVRHQGSDLAPCQLDVDDRLNEVTRLLDAAVPYRCGKGLWAGVGSRSHPFTHHYPAGR